MAEIVLSVKFSEVEIGDDFNKASIMLSVEFFIFLAFSMAARYDFASSKASRRVWRAL